MAPQPATQAISQTAAEQTVSAAKTAATAAPTVTAPDAAAGIITEAKALEIAYTHAGVKPEDILFSKVKLEYDDGVQEYDVNFFTQGKEYDYDILASTGEIRSYDYEVEDHAWAGQTEGSQTGPVTLVQAQQTALDRVPGADASHIRIKTDMDDGRTVYEGKIVYDNVEYEFEIDASTGTVLEWDSESVFD
ncbi:MAG: PepSY domain-containing protein [Clostridium sp.]|nr:PepSY domain-containing protein [Clostridium sp.]